jgi:hypothetical protein
MDMLSVVYYLYFSIPLHCVIQLRGSFYSVQVQLLLFVILYWKTGQHTQDPARAHKTATHRAISNIIYIH